MWTAAGLTVCPVTWTDRHAGRPAPLLRRSDVTTPRSLGLRVTRPTAEAAIVVHSDGSASAAVRRPGVDDMTHENMQLDSVDSFAALLDRVVELITWSGPHKARRPDPPPAQRAVHWVVGFDGLGWPDQP